MPHQGLSCHLNKTDNNLMKKLKASLAVFLLTASLAEAQIVASMSDVQLWTGSGTNRSVLVLQWNDGGSPSSLAWGYRWNGAATGMQLLTAIAGTTIIREPFGGDVIETLSGADPSLQLTIERYGFGDAIYAMVYSPGGTPRTQADWDAGYWQYLLHGGNFEYSVWTGSGFSGPFVYNVSGASSYGGVTWWSSQIGASDRGLVNGSWDAWSFAAGSVGKAVVQPTAAAVPEPRVTLLLCAALAVIALMRRRRGHAR